MHNPTASHTPAKSISDEFLEELARDAWLTYTSEIDAIHAESVVHDPTRRRGYVYLVSLEPPYIEPRSEDDLTRMVKIGISRSPKVRLSQLQRSVVKMPYELHQVHTFWAQDARRTEALIHRALRRHRAGGEWFRLSWTAQLAFMGIWYARGSTDDYLKFHDHAGDPHTLHDILLSDMRDQRRFSRISREHFERTQS